MTFIWFLSIVAAIIIVSKQGNRIRQLESRIDLLEARSLETQNLAPATAVELVLTDPAPQVLPTEPLVDSVDSLEVKTVATVPRVARTIARVADVAMAETATEADRSPVYDPPEPAPPARSLSDRVETLIGGKLPIWIGGIALVLAGFYLVRYSIERGLLGPGMRSLLAGLFGAALIAASEAVRFYPKIGDDKRIGQSLAGAGIASLYGTLYMASELYGLLSVFTAFTLLVIVTIGALILSLRQGPPTAIMGLIGGFVAPYVAGLAGGNLAPLLVYLALLMAGLFALAIHRGWLWLALAASGGGAIWTLSLILSGLAGADSATGIFVVVMAVVATLMLPRAGAVDSRVRLLPMVAGFVQLALFAPLIEFSAMGWALYGLLSAASLFLAWRDSRMTQGALVALGLVLALLIGGFASANLLAPYAAIGATLLFAMPGHAFALRVGDGRWWTIMGLVGGVAPLTAAMFGGTELLTDVGWGWLSLLAVVPPALMSLRARGEARAAGVPDIAHAGGAAVAAAMLMTSAVWLLPQLWLAVAAMVISATLSAWSRATRDRTVWIGSLVLAGLATLFWLGSLENDRTLIDAVLAQGAAPAFEIMLALIVVPALLAGGIAWLQRDQISAPLFHWSALGLIVALALALVPEVWHPAAVAAFAATLVLTAPKIPLPHFGIEGVYIAWAFSLLVPLFPYLVIYLEASFGATMHYAGLPLPLSAFLTLALPTLLAGGGLVFNRDVVALRFAQLIFAVGSASLIAFVYTLLKQPLAIATPPQFEAWGFAERMVITQTLFASAWLTYRFGRTLSHWALVPLALALFRFIWFDTLLLNPLIVHQSVGSILFVNWAAGGTAVTALWLWLIAPEARAPLRSQWFRYGALALSLLAVLVAVRQTFQGEYLDAASLPREENYAYSAALLLLSLGWLWRGIVSEARWLRLAGLALLTIVTLKVFLVDAAALEGLLRVLSFLGLGGALIGIGWAYGRLLGRQDDAAPQPSR